MSAPVEKAIDRQTLPASVRAVANELGVATALRRGTLDIAVQAESALQTAAGKAYEDGLALIAKAGKSKGIVGGREITETPGVSIGGLESLVVQRDAAQYNKDQHTTTIRIVVRSSAFPDGVPTALDASEEPLAQTQEVTLFEVTLNPKTGIYTPSEISTQLPTEESVTEVAPTEEAVVETPNERRTRQTGFMNEMAAMIAGLTDVLVLPEPTASVEAE